MKAILYTKNFDQEIKEKVNVILSPEFYWIKKIDLKIKTLKEAKKIAKNLFKLSEEEYFFDAFKLNDKFFAVAIKKNLDLNIEKKYINSIRLAQIEFYNFECIDAGECVLKKVEDIFFCFSKKEECIKIDEVLQNLKLSKHTFLYNSVNIGKTALFCLFAGLIIFNVIFLVKGFIYRQELNGIYQKEKLLSKKSNMPITAYQLNSIYNVLKKEDERVNQIKSALEVFSNMNEKFEKLSFDSKTWNIVIDSNKSLDKKFKKFKIISSGIKNSKYTAKLEYE